MAWWRRDIQVWPVLCSGGLTSAYLGEPRFLPAGSGTDLPGVAGEGRTPGRGQAHWRCAVKDRDRCQPEQPEKSSHESNGPQSKRERMLGNRGLEDEPEDVGITRSNTPAPPRGAQHTRPAGSQPWSSAGHAGVWPGQGPRPFFCPPHLALMDARQQLWAAGRIDTLINTARNRQRFSPPQTSWWGELGWLRRGRDELRR